MLFGISSEVIVTGMESLEELVNSLESLKALKSKQIISAFRKIDRKKFVSSDLKDYAYLDQPLPIGRGQTISQPYTVAFMLELLGPKKGDKVLDVGFGSGWTTALLAEIVGAKGKVYGLEINTTVFKSGCINLEKAAKRALAISNITLFNKSGWNGLIEHAPYDRILVSAAAGELPQALKDQLAVGGRLVIPIDQSIVMLERLSEDRFKEEAYQGFVFVPLVK